MKKRYLSKQEIYNIIKVKGVEEAIVEGYLCPEELRDRKLAVAVTRAREALYFVTTYWEALGTELYGKE